MIGVVLTVLFVLVLFGIRMSINDAIHARRHRRGDFESLSSDWRKRFDDRFKH